MKKNGFIATSILYSFFLVFLTLFVVLVGAYLHNRILLKKLNNSAWDRLMSINNVKISDLKVGDYVRFDTTTSTSVLNEGARWVVAYIEESGTKKTYYFLSDSTAQKQVVKFKASYDFIPKLHPMTLLMYNELLAQDLYASSFRTEGFKVYIPTSSLLIKARNQSVKPETLDSIFRTGDSYLVNIDTSISGTTYKVGSIYEVRNYNFELGSGQKDIIKNYCGGDYNGSNVVYNTNKFGYIHVTNDATEGESYVDFCSYASPIGYVHPASDLVVSADETRVNGDEVDNYYLSTYGYRLIAEITVDINDEETYMIGGKGYYADPYLFTNGVKVD